MSKARTRSCGCRATPRRRCALCDPERQSFVACSAACLHRHLREQHRVADATAPAQIGEALARLNRARQGRAVYASHRARLGRLLQAVQRAERLCVLGAGNGDDLDLPLLLRSFGEVHLVDLDAAALGLALERVEPSARAKVVAHAGLDLSGAVARLDGWGDAFPPEPELAAFAGEVSASIAGAVGGGFDVVLSACLLSQLTLPLRESLVLGMDDWQRLFGAVERAHLATVAALTRPGGTGVLALDVTSSFKLPELADFARPETWPGLGAAATAAITARKLALDPDPARLMALVTEPALAAVIERPRLTEPWVWDTGGGVFALVYALLFTRPER